MITLGPSLAFPAVRETLYELYFAQSLVRNVPQIGVFALPSKPNHYVNFKLTQSLKLSCMGSIEYGTPENQGCKGLQLT
jgi:hypothetical protein